MGNSHPRVFASLQRFLINIRKRNDMLGPLIAFPNEALPDVAGLRSFILRRLALFRSLRFFALKIFVINQFEY